MFDANDALNMLISAHEKKLVHLLSMRSSYGANHAPEELAYQIEQEEKTISELKLEAQQRYNTSNIPNITTYTSNPPQSFNNTHQNAEIFARIPQINDLLPILVPHNLVIDLKEYQRIQEISYTISGIMFGGVMGILTDWITSGTDTNINQATFVAMCAFITGTFLSMLAGIVWGRQRLIKIEQEINRYIASMQIIRVPYTTKTAKSDSEEKNQL